MKSTSWRTGPVCAFLVLLLAGCSPSGQEAPEGAPADDGARNVAGALQFELVAERDVVADQPVAFVVTARDTARTVPGPTVLLIDAPPDSVLDARPDGTHVFRWNPAPTDVGEVAVVFEARRPDDPAVRTRAEVLLRVAAAEPPALSRFGQAPPLRDLAAVHGLRLGFAAPHEMFELDDSALFTAIAAEEYDILTPENSMKMRYLRPAPGPYEWERSDRLIEFAEAHGMAVHGHPLIWSGQVSPWIKELGRSELAELMREHIATVVSRYRGRIEVWDVVNEAFFRDGSPRDTLWYLSMGEAYIAEAFRIAREHDPDVTLIYNDFDIAWLNPKSDALLEWLAGELERGTPIDGVGFQVHLETFDLPGVDSLRENFRRFAELGLDIYITEMDVAVDWQADPDVEALKQADVYADVLRICVEQPHCRALQTWGLGDRHAWRSSSKPMPFDDEYRAKPAFHAMQRVLQETPPTPRAPR